MNEYRNSGIAYGVRNGLEDFRLELHPGFFL